MTTLLKNNRTDRASLQKPAMTLVLLFSLFAFFLILTPILTGLLGRISHKHDAILRIAMVIQDLLVFILPALLTALVSTKLPARLLCIDTKPRAIIVLWSLLTLVVSIPAMNAIIEWNQNLHLPAAMSGFETTMRQLESNAQAVTDSLMAGASVPSLIVSILIVGILAGFSEELFFRGAMQRIMSASRMNMHAVIWSVAFIFSLFHFQFFGFAPRLLLGAYFGYLLWWSRSIWIPVFVHMFNNSLVVFTTWRNANNPDTSIDIDKLGSDLSTFPSIAMVCTSIALTIIALYVTRRQCLKNV